LCNKRLRYQNLLLLVSSYIFYGWWDWRFLILIIFSSFIDYSVGLQLNKTKQKEKRQLLMWLSILMNLGFLGFFKYYNFFAESFSDAFTFFGNSIDVNRLNIILPVGISFYTFQTLSYTIDVYRNKLKPTTDPVAFFAFVSFFPQLVAGPIERASTLLPQFSKKRKFIYGTAIDGIQQIIWGLFKKIVIADNCAQYVNDIFQNYTQYSSLTLLLGVIYFSFQIYADFSGYSDIAIGVSKLFGFKLMTNFNYPYFSKNIGEFWQKWHISLSTWFKDYVYIPLGGNRGNKYKRIRNTFLVFIISGFWHGANWTFIVWGCLNAVLFLPQIYKKKSLTYPEKNTTIVVFKMIITYTLISFTWIFFRANNLTDALQYIYRLFMFPLKIERLEIFRFSFELIPLIILLIFLEWNSRFKEHPLSSKRFNYFKSIGIIILILVFGSFSSIQDFIYFQF
jgi:D-alanyl-lipoteichoic acid acyltransferase DltB (MBOAT superfamily)